MNVCEEFSNLSSSVAAAGPELVQELSLPNDHCQTKSGGNVLLQLLEFKRHLLEVVEELHIRRDAEVRFEEQISKLMLEKQELEWKKESLQHQIETGKNQHAESLSKTNKEFQTIIRNIDEEKGRYQVSAELKDKEITNLKEELKSLQLLKYNLEKKSSELEQKLTLQSRSKDSHLNQLGEMEKRFSTLSRQCAMVKQAHEQLELNVDEAMKLNKKLTLTNEKHEVTIASLNKEVEELRNKLVKAKMSSVSHNKSNVNPTIREQNMKLLHQKLNMEHEMNRKLNEENKVLQAEKQEVLRSLQLAHQLLLDQTKTVSQLELDLQTQRYQHQSLEEDHKAMQEEEKAAKEEIKQLMEEYAVSKTCWDKEKAEFLDRVKNEQQELKTVKEAYEELHQKYSALSSQAKEQAQQINELKMKVKDQNLNISAPSKSSLEGGSSEDMTIKNVLHTPLSNNVQALLLAKVSDGPKDTEAIATGEQAAPTIDKESQSELLKSNNYQSSNSLSNLPNCPSVTILCENMSNYTNSSMNGDGPDIVTKSLSANSLIDNGVLISNNAHLDSSVTSSNNNGSRSVTLITENMLENIETEIKVDHSIKTSNYTTEKKTEKDKCEGETDKEKVAEDTENPFTEEKGDKMYTQNEREEIMDFALDSKNFETDTADKEKRDGNIDSLKVERHLQLTGDKNYADERKRDNTQVSHSLDSKEPQSASKDLIEKVEQAPHKQEIRREVLPEDFSESQVCESNTSHVHSNTVEPLPSPVCHDLEENAEMMSKESTTSELPETLNMSRLCHSQTDAAQLDSVSVQETQTQVVSHPDTPGHKKDTVYESAKECPLISEIVKTCLQSQDEIPEMKSSLADSGATDTACETSNNLTNVSENNDACETDVLDKSNLKRKQSYNVIENFEDTESQDKFDSRPLKITTQDTMSNQSESDVQTSSSKSPKSSNSECQELFVANETKRNYEFTVPFKTTYWSSFEWGTAQRKVQSYATGYKPNFSSLDGSFTTSQMSQLNTTGFIGHSSSLVPIFPKSKYNKVPLVITRATNLLNASSVCGTAASSKSLQPGEWRAIGEAHRETGAMESRIPQSIGSFSASASSGNTNRPGTPSSDASRSPESEPSCSLDTEDQQSSFRAQISKIEQFLNTERLRLPKRRKTEN